MTATRDGEAGGRWIEGCLKRRARNRYECQGNGARRALRKYAPACTMIMPTTLYMEYVGESAAYESGSRHCLACADAFFGAEPAPPPVAAQKIHGASCLLP